jgi:hypothetical protein
VASVIELDVSSAGARGSYRVQITQSPAGEASDISKFDPDEFIDRLDDFGQTLLASTVSSRRLLTPGESSVREIGQRLFDVLFSPGTLAGIYRASCAVAAERGEPLRMVLRVNAPELAALPWEAMFDETLNSYVCRREPLVRYLPVASSPPPLTVGSPLRILAVIASPRGLTVLDTEKEKADLTRALAQPIARGLVVVHWLEHATWPALHDALLSGTWHVVHFIGHGDFDSSRDEGVLALETEQGRVHRVVAEHLVDLFREAHPMPRLVVLNACESAASGSTDMFSGTAAALVRGGVSAVAAMQFPISDDAAIAFGRGFYAALVQGRGIDEALRSGRVSILGLGADTLEWITPALFLRGRETQLFAITASGQEERAAPHAGAVDRPASRPGLETPTAGHEDRARLPEEYPGRLAEIWSTASQVGWSDRPFKSNVSPLANVVPPEERIVGCCRFALTMFSACAVLVTERHMYLSQGSANDKWRELLAAVPSSYRLAPDWIRFPLPEHVEAGRGQITLFIDGEEPVRLRSSEADRFRALITKFLVRARNLDRFE